MKQEALAFSPLGVPGEFLLSDGEVGRAAMMDRQPRCGTQCSTVLCHNELIGAGDGLARVSMGDRQYQ